MTNIQLSNEEKIELKTLYLKLNNLCKQKAVLEVLKKERENTIKEEFASACNIVNKNGETQANKVKMPLVCSLIDELFNDLPNKKRIEYEIMQEYESAISNKEINNELLRSYADTNTELKENRNEMKEAFKESSILSKEVLEALNYLIKEEYKIILNAELEKQGYEVKENKDKTDLSLLQEIREIIKELLK